jgi:hypothetical protein
LTITTLSPPRSPATSSASTQSRRA